MSGISRYNVTSVEAEPPQPPVDVTNIFFTIRDTIRITNIQFYHETEYPQFSGLFLCCLFDTRTEIATKKELY